MLRVRGNLMQFLRLRHKSAAFVLVIVCLRMLVPDGFMLIPAHGGFTVVVCNSSAHHTVNHGDNGNHDHGHVHPDSGCQCAQSNSLSAPPAVAFNPPLNATVWSALTLVAQTNIHFGPIRQHSARGPPALT